MLNYFPSLIGNFFTLEIPTALTFLIATRTASREALVSAGGQIAVIHGLIGSATFVWLSQFFPSVVERGLGFPIAIVCLLAPAMVVNPHLYAIHRGLGRFDFVNGLLISLAISYGLLPITLWSVNRLTPLTLAAAIVILQTVLAAGSAWPLRRYLAWRVPLRAYKMCYLQAGRFLIPALVASAFLSADQFVLLQTSSLEEIGYFFVASSVTYPLVLAAEAFAQLSFVEISSEARSDSGIRLLVRRFGVVQVLVGGLGFLVYPLLGPVTRFGYGTAFDSAVPVAEVLLPAMALRALCRTLESGLRARNLILPGTVANAVGLLTLVALGLVWTPISGARGFASAMLVAQAATLCTIILYLSKVLKVNLTSLWGLRPSVARTLLDHTLALFELRRS